MPELKIGQSALKPEQSTECAIALRGCNCLAFTHSPMQMDLRT